MGYMDLPPEIQEKMLAEQEKQTGVRNYKVFTIGVNASRNLGGFTWGESDIIYGNTDGEKDLFWDRIIVDGDFSGFYALFPKHTQVEQDGEIFNL